MCVKQDNSAVYAQYIYIYQHIPSNTLWMFATSSKIHVNMGPWSLFPINIRLSALGPMYIGISELVT